MNNIKHTMKLFIIALLVSMSASSCQDQYPDLEDGLYAEINTTKGIMVAKLYYEKAPVTVANFVGLAEGTHPSLADSLKGKPFYDGIIFHRVMDKFMIQGGDPTATGTGSAGYKFYSEFDTSLSHDKAGILSMANSGGLNTNGSQFFITEIPFTKLDAFTADGSLKNCDGQRVSCHPVFGELVKGLEVQDSISNLPVSKERGRVNRPLEDVVINKVTIIRKGKSAKAFDATKVFTELEPLLPQRLIDMKTKQEALAKEKSKAAAQDFIKANTGLEGEIFESPTGIVMIHNKIKNGVKPNTTDKVLVNCSAYFMNDNLLYTTYVDIAKKMNQYDEQQDKGGAYKPFPMIYNESAGLVAGFREAMLRMNVGDKARVYVPSYLGYGAGGRPPKVPGNTDLYFDIEISGIQ
ncbi:peptidylprolyl isomerase [Lacinutrix sp. Bg11-31]|uniref:peptidylprolyl isomerase n=1 Tax=Lacinutrix sp. Bg11-31 TaxID=2057808 RepID=UPI000C313780|nr:peptidylprolyl isomerase [Lacinutrix sp. Bg11-31]AUC80861.1 peptidylprolyl isomerase [Lacinutrix sp. Bg11-31]